MCRAEYGEMTLNVFHHASTLSLLLFVTAEVVSLEAMCAWTMKMEKRLPRLGVKFP